MIGRRELDTIAKINARCLADHDKPGLDPEESSYGGGAVLRLIARQVAAFQLLNPAFDARRFVKASGITEDWLQSRVLGWAAKDE